MHCVNARTCTSGDCLAGHRAIVRSSGLDYLWSGSFLHRGPEPWGLSPVVSCYLWSDTASMWSWPVAELYCGVRFQVKAIHQTACQFTVHCAWAFGRQEILVYFKSRLSAILALALAWLQCAIYVECVYSGATRNPPTTRSWERWWDAGVDHPSSVEMVNPPSTPFYQLQRRLALTNRAQ